MKAVGVKDVGENSLIAFRKEDNKRISAAMQKVQKKYKIWRLTRKRTATSVIQKSKEHYEAGGFDIDGEKMSSISNSTSKPMKRRRLSSASFTIIDSVIEDIKPVFCEPLEAILPVNNVLVD